jgi:signal transduction histidine kinase
MTDPTTPQTPPDGAPELARQLAEAQAEVQALRTELEETNSGVLALYAELDMQASELRQATELKSRFLAYMSHEFRTPVGAILSISRLLIDHVDGPLTEEQDKQVRFIRDTAHEFSEMVNDLLDLAKVEAGRIDISADWFDMVDLFSALRGMFKPVLTNADVVLIFEEPEGVPKLYNDDRKLAQILRNFISNALKFTPSGEVRVSVRVAGHESVTFAVADTGIGIDPQFHHAIFQDFSQLDSPIQKRLRGTGLGLSLSKRLAELMGGTVALVSELNKGSTFSVTLPMHFGKHADVGVGRSGEHRGSAGSREDTGPLSGVPVQQPGEAMP